MTRRCSAGRAASVPADAASARAATTPELAVAAALPRCVAEARGLAVHLQDCSSGRACFPLLGAGRADVVTGADPKAAQALRRARLGVARPRKLLHGIEPSPPLSRVPTAIGLAR